MGSIVSAFVYSRHAFRRFARELGKATLIFVLVFGWVFSGWPQVPLASFPPRPQRAEAATIAYVGGQSGNSIGATGNTQVDFALTGGIDTIPRAGDLVIISFSCSDNSNKTLTIQDAASGGNDYTYAGGGDLYQNGSTYDSNFVVGYKRMGATPDAQAFLAGGDGTGGRAWTVHVFRDVDPNSPLDVSAVTTGGTGTHLADPNSILPSTSGAWIYVAGAGATATGAAFSAGYLSAFLTDSGADSQDSDVGAGYVTWTSGSYDPAAFTGGGTDAAADSWNAVTLALRPDQTTEDQEGFAFGDDDGSESAHTLDTQDSHLTAAVGTKSLRVIVNSTGDKPANAFKLKYQKNGAGGYEDVPVGEYALETATYQFNGLSGTTGTWSTTANNIVDGDDGTYGRTNVDGTTAILDGNQNDGTDLGTITKVEVHTSWASNGTKAVPSLTVVFGGTSTSSDTHTVTTFSSAQTDSDWFDITNDDSAPGTWTWSDVQNLNMLISVARTNNRIDIYYVDIRVTYISTTPNEVYVSASGNVVAGGESTTARLTPPSGKTTGDFTTGRRWDDENGDDTIDIANNFYTEVEWVLTTQSPATTDDYYEFRVYKSNVAFDTYAVTPKWTIGEGGGEPAEEIPSRSLRLISSKMIIHQGSRVIIQQR